MNRWALMGLLAFGISLGNVACGDSTGGSGGSGGTSASSTTTASTGTGGTGGMGSGGGNMVGTGGAGGAGGGATGTGVGGSGGSGGSGTGGSGGSNYTVCSDCTADNGAPANECKAAYDACMASKECVLLYQCNYMGVGGGPGPCDSTQDGACCSLACDKLSPTPDGVKLYRALDQCIYCKTCAALCDTAAYCKVFEPGGDSVCN